MEHLMEFHGRQQYRQLALGAFALLPLVFPQ